MSKKTIKQKPSEQFPGLVEYLAKISKAAYELYQLTKPEEAGKALDIKRQSFQAHIDKLKEETK